MSLRQHIKARIQDAHWRFHVPGHAGQALCEDSAFDSRLFQLDVTELPGLDVLGHPEGVLADLQRRIASIYNTQQSFCLINGASVGLMAALLSLPQPLQSNGQPGKVLITRNAHRSVIHGLILTGHQPVWILPDVHPDWGIWGAISAEAINTTLQQHPDITAVILTHPTYEGVSSPIHAIAALCHDRGIPLIVDEAHGSLWPLCEDLPESALTQGADIVVHSLHKSAGALTQCALVHIGHNSLIRPERLQHAINTLHTTSPAYPLLVSIEETVDYWASTTGQEKLKQQLSACNQLRDWIRNTLKQSHVSPVGSEGFQLLLRHDSMSAEAFATALEDTHGIAFESLNDQSVFLHLNPGLPAEGLEALRHGLMALDTASDTVNEPLTRGAKPEQFQLPFTEPQVVMTPRQAFFSVGEACPIAQALGRISRQVVATCPPGIAILMPGEEIQSQHIQLLQPLMGPDTCIDVLPQNTLASLSLQDTVTDLVDASPQTVDKPLPFAYS
jgi:arginine decarboxylase